MTTDTIGRYAPMPEPGDVRASGGIVHSDGNIFFTNIEKMESLFRAYADATCALREEQRPAAQDDRAAFERGDIVRKRSGSAWEGRVCGEYSTSLTPKGYAVESDKHPGSVQIYPEAALELIGRERQAALASRPVPPPISESAIREAQDAEKDCRTCQRYVHAQCALPDGHSGCTNMSAYVPTQPVRLWEK